MADNSDYTKNRINVLDYLEGTTFDTPVNQSLVENTFNRFLTKDETVESIGTIGQPDAALALNRQLKEDTIHRQTYQLQPLVHKKVATVDYTMSFKDMLSELERLGVDVNRLPSWGDTEQFNFAPPVDLDKLINYRDYYWYDPDGISLVPQYIVIKNPCTVANNRLGQRQKDIAGVGAQLGIIGVDLGHNEFILSSDLTSVFPETTLFDVVGSEPIDGQYHVASARYDAGKTYIKPTVTIPSNLYNGASITFDSQIAALTADRNRICDASAGWDVGMWDDAPTVTGGSISATDPVLLQLLKDTDPDMYTLIITRHPEYVDSHGNILAIDPRPLYTWMDQEKPEFDISWDAQGTRTKRNAWQVDNKWVHKLDVAPGVISKSVRAEAPIMEYLPNLQLNAWSEVRYQWMYRADPIREQFQLTDAIPTMADYNASDFLDKWVYVDQIETVPTTYQIENSTATVMSSDSSSSAVLELMQSYIVTGVVAGTKRVTFDGAPALPIGTELVFSDGIEFNRKLTTSAAVSANGSTTVTVNDVGGVAVGQELFIKSTSVYNVAIFPEYKQQVAMAGTNAPRVYVDEVQLLGTFDEITVLGANGKYYVGAIRLDTPVSTEQRLDIGVDPAAQSDIGKGVWNVRTSDQLDDKKYQEDGRPTTIVSVVSFFKMEQSKKTGEDKIPLFDLFFPTGETANKANQIFFYQLDQSAAVNSHTGLRLKTTTATATVYHFEQLLIDYDNGPMLCYKDLDSVDSTNPSGLQTIWRTDLDNRYVPRFVDVNRRADGDIYYDANGVEHVAEVDSTNGDWEIINQMMYNASHENKKYINSTDLTEHIKTILKNQKTLEGFLPSNYGFRLLDEINYGIGGTIKEHNGSFDTLASALFVTGSTPPAVIQYAETAYETALAGMEDYVLSNAADFLTNRSHEYLADLGAAVTEAAIETHESNNNNNVVFGDSNTYIDGKGIKNWPATIPFLGLGPLYRPTVITDATLDINDIMHHDGHYATYTVSQGDQIGIARRVTRTKYTNSENGEVRYYGWTPQQAADGGALVADYNAIDWHRLRAGDLWVNGQTFKRFQVIQISTDAPGADIVDGALWLRSTDGQLMVKQTVSGQNVWNVLAGSPAGDVTAAWKDVSLSAILNAIVFEVETRLFEACEASNITASLPQTMYVRKQEDVPVYNALRETSFDRFTRERQINAPYASVYKQTDPFTWNFSGVDANLVLNGSYVNVWNPYPSEGHINWAGYWAGVYLNVYGTAYPHREPWVLQGYSARPEWWDEWYVDTTGTRVWNAAMWTNVLANRIPAQYDAPSEVLYQEVDPISGIEYKIMTKKFTYVPVNLTRVINKVGGGVLYKLDDLFPIYDTRLFTSANLDIVSGGSVGKPMIRRTDAVQGVNMRLPFQFGDGSPVEFEWLRSTDSRYGEIETAFLMQPIRFMDTTWGTKFVSVGNLKINTETHKVFSHWDTIFHGDVVDSKTYQVVGLNQWYVNYNRSSGLDFKVSNFREMWTEWAMKLAYQFGCYINTRSLDVSSTSYDMIREDFSIISKKSTGFAQERVDSLQVTVANYGDYRVRGNLRVPTGDGYTWEFLVDVPSTATEIEYYGVAKYNYTVVDMETGLLEITDGIIPWVDGDAVYLYSTQYAPYPLDTAWTHYVSTVPNNPKQFRVSRSKVDAMNGVGIRLRTEGTGIQQVGEVRSTFIALNGDATPNPWKHNAIDKNRVYTVTLPYVVQGVQGLIDFVDGYAARLEDNGIRVNDSSAREIDPTTGRLVSWQTETERAIAKIYTGIGKSNTSIKQYGNTYEYAIQDVTQLADVFEIKGVSELPFQLAQEVYMFTTGVVPAGLVLNTPYYVIPLTATSFQLASTPENAYDDIAINVTSEGIGQQFVGVFPSTFVAGDEYAEINPFRNNIWIRTEAGLVADVFTGGSEDATEEVTVYDQYGRPLPKGSLTVLRQDTLTRVAVREGMTNDVVIGVSATDPYNYIHIGGVKFYIDGYEHVVLFNDYTTEGYLIYDPYIGMDVSLLSVSFSRAIKKTLRPSIGGYYFHDGEMLRNLEASVSDMRSYYDTYGGTSTSDFLDYSRALLGYEDPTYLDQLNTSERAKFLFWKGMIQRKGSKNTINAFINSKHFVDAHVDEFWAYKVAEFGDARQKYKPEMNIRVNDAYTSDFRYEFAAVGDPVSSRFVGINYADQGRWVNPMEVQNEMNGNPLYFDAEQVTLFEPVISSDGQKYIVLDRRLDGVSVQYVVGNIAFTLTVGNGLTKLNDRVYQVANTVTVAQVYVVGYEAATSKLDPINVIDQSSNASVAASKVWDPANGYHYYSPMRYVNYWMDADPATYDGVAWTSDQVGKRWVDNSSFKYVPYDDTKIFSELSDRLARWGRLAGYVDPAVYEWVRSTRAPADFEAAIPAEEGDATIAIANRASGIPYKVIRRTTDDVEITMVPVTSVFDVSAQLTAMKANPLYVGLDIHVYVNGEFKVQRSMDTIQMSDFTYAMGDYVTLVPALPVGMDGYYYDYRFATVIEADEQGNDVTVYYFWTRARNVAAADEMTTAQVQSSLAAPSAPYHVYKKFVEASGSMPNRYTQVILRNVAQLVNDDNRYIAQFTRDFTLRDKLSSGKSAMDLKNKHAEWVLFREKQPYKITKDLWDKMAEALIGYEIEGFDTGTRTPVPSLTYALYDEKNSTTTRFGMEKGQAFVDRAQGLETIQTLLESPTFDTAPIDKYVFLETYTFDTPVNIRLSLEYIFSNFSDTSVNHLYFEVLRDALSNKTEFSDLFMSSFIALHGIKILETSGSVV